MYHREWLRSHSRCKMQPDEPRTEGLVPQTAWTESDR